MTGIIVVSHILPDVDHLGLLVPTCLDVLANTIPLSGEALYLPFNRVMDEVTFGSAGMLLLRQRAHLLAHPLRSWTFVGMLTNLHCRLSEELGSLDVTLGSFVDRLGSLLAERQRVSGSTAEGSILLLMVTTLHLKTG